MAPEAVHALREVSIHGLDRQEISAKAGEKRRQIGRNAKRRADQSRFLWGLMRVLHEICSAVTPRIYTHRNEHMCPEAASFVITGCAAHSSGQMLTIRVEICSLFAQFTRSVAREDVS